MGTMIEVGAGWYYWDQEWHEKRYEAFLEEVREWQKTKDPRGLDFYGRDSWILISPAECMELLSGEDVKLASELDLVTFEGSSVQISSHQPLGSEAYTEVKFDLCKPTFAPEFEDATEGDVTDEILFFPPTIVYKLMGPGAVLEFSQKFIGYLRVTNRPDYRLNP